MNLTPILTDDGSTTLFSTEFNAHYHSTRGALTEAVHVFIQAGYRAIERQPVSLLEVGFGTGLNAALTAHEATLKKKPTHYTGLELYPLPHDYLGKLNYNVILDKDILPIWEQLHAIPWNAPTPINEFFTLTKLACDFTSWFPSKPFDLIYFDAFAPNDQPEMWRKENFAKLYHATSPHGILVTYCSKGVVKQALREAGYRVTRLAGPPGKRHIVRAVKD
jgi:tRNA U34 5-methylaminomethyl-2-thiouridine-forming methyltransferase MnmC